MSEEIIMKSLNKCLEYEQKKPKEEPKVKTEQIKETPKKKPINWKAIEENIKKYDSLSKEEQIKKYGQAIRTIPFWRRALEYHNQGLSDSKAKEKAQEK